MEEAITCCKRLCVAGCRWFTLTHLDGSLVELVQFAQKAGFDGVRASWPWPSREAWAIIASFGGLQAFLQVALPGAVHKGPVSPKGNVPVYKVILLSLILVPVSGADSQN